MDDCKNNTVRNVIDQHAATQADATYLITPQTEQTMSYGELQQQAQALSQQLIARGMGQGDKVAMLLDNGYHSVVIMLGVMYSGAVIVPMNAVAGESVLTYVLEHSDARMLFVCPHYQDKYPLLMQAVPEHISIIPVDNDGFSPSEITSDMNSQPITETSLNLPEITPDDHAVLIYTSGTTGRPKGVLLSHRNILAGGNNTATAHQLTRADRGLCVLPLYHINAEIVSLISSLLCGGSVVLPTRFSVSTFWQHMMKYECSWFSLVPTIVTYLLDHESREPIDNATRNYIKQHVRFGRSASAPLSPEMHREFERRFSLSLIETMGLTETAAQILSNPLPPGNIKYGSPGIAFGNEAKIMDEQGEDCPAGVSGELMIRGDNVMCGYYKNETATAEAFSADGWLHTGDLAQQDEDGYFFITGRLKELIIKGGENISPREIDEAFFGHPAILEAAAFAVPDRAYGQEIMACVVFKQGEQADTEELQAYIESQLGRFKMPKEVYVVDELPKGPSGKVQRLKLGDWVAEK